MRILFQASRDWTHPEATGGDACMCDYARYLARRGHDVTVVAARYPGSARSERRDGVTIVRLGGMFFHATGLVWIGIAMFSAFVVFTLITLPVEFNASNRAVAVLEQTGMITAQEVDGTRAVLNAAALTYVAAAIGAVMQLLYLLWQAGLLGGRRSED